MTGEDLFGRMHSELLGHADPGFRARITGYFGQDDVTFLGVRTRAVRRISTRYYQEIKPLGIDGVLDWCERLLETRLSEHRTIAFDWAFRCRRQYRPEHFTILERWLETYVDSWGGCDDLCAHALGDIILRYPEYIARVKHWTHSENRWLRRASAVTFIYGARRGKNLEHIFEVADALLMDGEDMVQKGCGWMLKVVSERFEDEVFHYVMDNKARMSRTTLRYAIEEMSEERRCQAMSKT